jgi:hypothetical protein
MRAVFIATALAMLLAALANEAVRRRVEGAPA